MNARTNTAGLRIPRPDQRPTAFPPSSELAMQMQKLTEQQIAIDRHNAQRLARLRAIRDQD